MRKLCIKFRKLRTRSLSDRLDRAERPFSCDVPAVSKAEGGSDLFSWYLGFLIQELRPIGTYYGHITALSILQQLARDVADTKTLQSLLSSSITRTSELSEAYNLLSEALLQLVFDPFDDVRGICHMLLKDLVRSELQCRRKNATQRSDETTGAHSGPTRKAGIIDRISDILPKARKSFLKSGKGNLADCFGRLMSLKFEAVRYSNYPYDETDFYRSIEASLETHIQTAHSDLALAVESAPLHGDFIALR